MSSFITYTILQWTTAKNAINTKNHMNLWQKKCVNSDIFKNTGNTGHFRKNTGFYRTSKKNTGHYRKYRTATWTELYILNKPTKWGIKPTKWGFQVLTIADSDIPPVYAAAWVPPSCPPVNRWNDNSVATLFSNCNGVYALGAAQRWSCAQKKLIGITQSTTCT